VTKVKVGAQKKNIFLLSLCVCSAACRMYINVLSVFMFVCMSLLCIQHEGISSSSTDADIFLECKKKVLQQFSSSYFWFSLSLSLTFSHTITFFYNRKIFCFMLVFPKRCYLCAPCDNTDDVLLS